MSKSPSLTSMAISSKKEELVNVKSELASLIRMQKDMRIQVKANRDANNILKAADRAEKKAAKIAKLEAKLIALKTGNVGSIAIKMNKKPSACTTVYQMAA